MKKQNYWWTSLFLMMFLSLGTVQAQTTHETLNINFFNSLDDLVNIASDPAIWKTSGNPDDDLVYVGEVSNGVPNGLGTFTFPGGEKYVGPLKDGVPNGQGTFTFPSGGKYVGEFKDGDYHGQGTITTQSGNKYVGEFKNAKKHGQGTYTFPDGQEVKVIYIDDELVGQQFE